MQKRVDIVSWDFYSEILVWLSLGRCLRTNISGGTLPFPESVLNTYFPLGLWIWRARQREPSLYTWAPSFQGASLVDNIPLMSSQLCWRGRGALCDPDGRGLRGCAWFSEVRRRAVCLCWACTAPDARSRAMAHSESSQWTAASQGHCAQRIWIFQKQLLVKNV